MTAKVTISMPDELLARLDAEAASAGCSRSEIAQEAMGAYLSRTADERAADERRRRVAAAIEGMLHFMDGKPILDDRPSIEILREIRETDDSAPLRGGRS